MLGGLFLKYFGSGKYNLCYWVIGPVLRDMGLNIKFYNSLKLEDMYENDDKVMDMEVWHMYIRENGQWDTN